VHKLASLSYKIENIIIDKGFIIKLLCFNDSSNDDFDLTILTIDEKIIYDGFKSIKRKLEYYFTRVLWKEFEIKQKIRYNEFGRPFIENGHISISHSHDIIVIAIDKNHPVGIDVEYKSPKITAIKHKFISKDDQKLIDFEDETQLTIVWSIKEAVYKMEDIPALSFKENIHVKIEDNLSYVNVNKEGIIQEYTFQYILRPNYILTYCTHGDLNKKLDD